MEQQIFVPDIGDYSDVEIIEIPVKSGDDLRQNDTILTLETDKATMDIPAAMDLTIKTLHVKLGDRVSKGSLIATVSKMVAPHVEKSSNADQKAAINNNYTETQGVLSASTGIDHDSPRSDISASPGVRKFARELGVDWLQLSSSHHRGRIFEQDIKDYVYNILSGNKSPLFNQPVANSNQDEVDFSKWGEISKKPLTRIKKKSGQNLHKNWLSIPHVTHFDTADITELEIFRKQRQKLLEQQSANVKLTLLAFLIKAVTNALQQFVNFNSSLATDGEHLIIKKYYHIGVAVDTELGLFVPVIKDADCKAIIELAQTLLMISEQARNNKLSANDLQGGTFTISSLGGIGGDNFTPIINAPQVAILGVSRAKLTPVYLHNELVPRLILPLSLSYDHRVIDGGEAAKFVKFIVQQLEQQQNFYV